MSTRDLMSPNSFTITKKAHHLEQDICVYCVVCVCHSMTVCAHAICILTNLGNLYSRWRNKESNALEAYEDALDCLRDNMSLHGSTPDRQETLAGILAAQGEVHT